LGVGELRIQPIFYDTPQTFPYTSYILVRYL